MSLRTATLYDALHIKYTTQNGKLVAAVLPQYGVSVECKNDNFATQVDILNNNDIDIFKYKYVTFDGHALFEIIDCIRNFDTYTIFIQYLSDIAMDGTYDTNFSIEAATANELQKLGLNINELFGILGREQLRRVEYNNGGNGFKYGVKIRFSRCPENLQYCLDIKSEIKDNVRVPYIEWGGSNTASQAKYFPTGRSLGAPICRASRESNINPDGLSITAFSDMDSAFTVVIPIPIQDMELVLTDSVNNVSLSAPRVFTFSDLITALSTLITDLVLSMEIVIFHKNYLVGISIDTEDRFNYIRFEDTRIVVDGRANLSNVKDKQFLNGAVLVLDDIDSEYVGGPLSYIPIFACVVTDYKVGGIAQVYAYFQEYIDITPRLDSTENYMPCIVTSLKFLNNKIDLTGCDSGGYSVFVGIEQDNQKIRIWVNYDKGIYQDIVTTLEYAKNAYSNYEAYTKANVELINAQNLQMVRQQNEQARALSDLNLASQGARTLGGAALAGGIGSLIGVIGALVSGSTNLITSSATENMREQNNLANAKLAASQALNKAKRTIVPTSETAGSITLNDLYILSDKNFMCEFGIEVIDLNPTALSLVYQYTMNNQLMEECLGATVDYPAWISRMGKRPFQIKFGTDPEQTRKPFVAMCYIENS